VYCGILILIAADAEFAHFLVVANLIVREILLAEYDVEAHSEYSYAEDGDYDEKYFHYKLY